MNAGEVTECSHFSIIARKSTNAEGVYSKMYFPNTIICD